jgi:hypothetical protein
MPKDKMGHAAARPRPAGRTATQILSGLRRKRTKIDPLRRPAGDALTTWDGDMRTYIGLIIPDSNEDETPSMPCPRLPPLCPGADPCYAQWGPRLPLNFLCFYFISL